MLASINKLFELLQHIFKIHWYFCAIQMDAQYFKIKTTDQFDYNIVID